MERSSVSGVNKVLVAGSFIVMIAANALANLLPINGVSTADITDKFYPNLFAPTGLTFAIWGVIYALLLAHTLYHLGVIRVGDGVSVAVKERVGVLFTISSLVNAVWIFAWHYDLMWLTQVLMVALLVLLAVIVNTIKGEAVSAREYILLRLPFSVYFGWITVATIANTVVLLVSLGWNGFGVAPETWMVVILIVGALIASVTALRNKDVAYGLVPIWAYYGIYLRHTNLDEFAGQYPAVVVTAIACIIVFATVVAYLSYSKKWWMARS